MTTTTSIKLPDDLKAKIAKVAHMEGKTAHALMVETLQTVMDDALARQQFYADGGAAYEERLNTNAVYRVDDVHAYLTARVAGFPSRPLRFHCFHMLPIIISDCFTSVLQLLDAHLK